MLSWVLVYGKKFEVFVQQKLFGISLPGLFFTRERERCFIFLKVYFFKSIACHVIYVFSVVGAVDVVGFFWE